MDLFGLLTDSGSRGGGGGGGGVGKSPPPPLPAILYQKKVQKPFSQKPLIFVILRNKYKNCVLIHIFQSFDFFES